MVITQQTWKVLGGIVTMLSVPLTNILVRHFGEGIGPDVKDVLDILSVLSVIGGGGYTIAQTTPRAQIENVTAVPGVASVVVKDNANGPIGALAADASHPKVLTETDNKLDVLNKAS